MAVAAVKNEPAKAAAEAPAEAAPAKKKLNIKLVAIVVVLLAAIGGGAYWWMHRSHGEEAAEAKAEPEKPPQFLPLETFTVNLQHEDNPQYLQVGLTLKVRDEKVGESLKAHMPELRDAVLFLLSSQKASVLLTVEGKRALAQGIADSINSILEPGSVKAEKPKGEAAKAAPAEKTDGEPEAKPAEEGDTKAAEGDAKPEGEAKAEAPARKPGPVLGVLFTSFIVQ